MTWFIVFIAAIVIPNPSILKYASIEASNTYIEHRDTLETALETAPKLKVNMSWHRPTVHHDHFIVSYPQEHVVQVTINRPDKLNCINQATSRHIAQVWDDLDADPTLWVGIITGRGRAFCTGADLHGAPSLPQKDIHGVA